MNIKDTCVVLVGKPENRTKIINIFGFSQLPFVFQSDTYDAGPTNEKLMEVALSQGLNVLPSVVLTVYCDSFDLNKEIVTHDYFHKFAKYYLECYNWGSIFCDENSEFLIRSRLKMKGYSV